MVASSLLSAAEQVVHEFEAKKIQLAELEKDIKTTEDELVELVPRIQLYEEVRVFLQELAKATRDEIVSGLEQVVTLCLQIVYGPDVSFEIEVDTSHNRTVIDFYVVNRRSDPPVRLQPENNMGGGVVDVAAIGLRFGVLLVLRPRPLGPMMLDEPAKMVSADFIGTVGVLLKEMRPMFNKQILMVTHHEPLAEIADEAFRVLLRYGKSEVTPLSRIHDPNF